MSDFSKEYLIKKGSETTGFDLRKLAKPVTGVLFLFIVGFVFYYFLPYLKEIVWNLVSITIAVSILAFFAGIYVFAGKQIRWLFEVMSKKLWGLIIEMDEFIFQEKQIQSAEEDLEVMAEEQTKIRGKYYELAEKVEQRNTLYQRAKEAESIARQSGDIDSIEDKILEQQRHLTYVESIGPIVKDLETMDKFISEVHKVLERRIRNAKEDLITNKDIFYSAEAGANALSSAERAAMGDSNLNALAERAKNRVKEKIALSVGQMRSSMEVLRKVSTEQNLNDAAALSLARKKLAEINDISLSGLQPTTSVRMQGVEMPKKFGDFI